MGLGTWGGFVRGSFHGTLGPLVSLRHSAMENIAIARLLDETAALLEIDAADPFRIRSYRRAAEAVEQCAVSCCQGAEENVGDRDAFVSGDGRSTPMMHYRQMIAPIVVR